MRDDLARQGRCNDHEVSRALGSLQRESTFMDQSMAPSNSTTDIANTILYQQKQALAILFRRKWFNRVWTLQEVLLATNTKCLCGPHELDIGTACMVAALLVRSVSSNRATSDMSGGFGELSIGQLGGAACISAWLGLTWSGSGFGSRALLRYPKIDLKEEIPRKLKWLVALELLVHESRQRSCSKLEDKVLAPLAFALRENFAPNNPDFLSLATEARRIIGYRFPITELYSKFTRFMLHSMGNLDILSRTHRDVIPTDTTEELKLPSWVPQFHQAGMTSLIDDLFFTQYNAAEHLGPYSEFEHGSSKMLELPV
ncbi:hypothetical protein BDV27DRAFT_161219 [Aspergillus caelatus]|uniref:Heterokaryon incompatibility domain-containing protein n=1 Tax=Aspergillus caelatus TaxID=61420 RepID=A0A5N6ZU24_9EURO|nr:uncharacterized protein BDV27DRAFT_161219 [Aspergillus caelatus]KAE8360898.1 hypothetical protein BDV27DRAFT_161219 [Aspergillus caelatus]